MHGHLNVKNELLCDQTTRQQPARQLCHSKFSHKIMFPLKGV